MAEKQTGLLGLVAGAAAGSVESFVTYPTEYVKTRAQLAKKQAGNKIDPKASRLTEIIKQTYRTNGISGFYRGAVPVVFGNALKAGTRFFTFEAIRDLLKDKETGRLTPAKNMLAGIGAGCIESIVAVTPSESIKTRLIQHNASSVVGIGKTSNVEFVSQIVRNEGALALYKGLLPTMLKQSANSATRFTSYEFMKDFLKARSPTGQVTNTQTVLIGSAAGVITVCQYDIPAEIPRHRLAGPGLSDATMPFDVVKTRMQQGGGLYRNSLDCLVSTVQNEGVLAFWKGSSPRVARLTISGSVTFIVYENVLKWLKAVTP